MTIGSFRGRISLKGEGAEELLAEILGRAADRAAAAGVRIVVEAANRYELDFINNAAEGIAFVMRLVRPGAGPPARHLPYEYRRIVVGQARSAGLRKPGFCGTFTSATTTGCLPAAA